MSTPSDNEGLLSISAKIRGKQRQAAHIVAGMSVNSKAAIKFGITLILFIIFTSLQLVLLGEVLLLAKKVDLRDYSIQGLATFTVFAPMVWAVMQRILNKRPQLKDRETTYTIAPSQLIIQRGKTCIAVGWCDVLSITMDDRKEYLFISLNWDVTEVIPVDAFPSFQEADWFYTQLKAHQLKQSLDL